MSASHCDAVATPEVRGDEPAGLFGPAAPWLDTSRPKPLADVAGDLVVAIDCDVPAARRWILRGPWPEPAVGAELRALTAALAVEMSADR